MIFINAEALVQGLRCGDELAAQKFVDTFYQPIMAYLFRMLQDPQGAEDVCQEVFVRAIHRIDQLRDPKGLKAWLYRMATNAAHDVIRQRPADIPLSDVTGDEHFDPAPGDRLYVADLLNTLGDDHRAIVILRYYEDLSLPQIRDVLGIPIGTVKSRLHYALKTLRAQLENQEREAGNCAIKKGNQTSPSHVG